MPRAGQVKAATEPQVSDLIAVGMLMRTFPPALVDRVIEECDRRELRSRLLPARVVVYFVLTMCLFSQRSYEAVARLLTQGMAWARPGIGSRQVPTTAAICRARAKLGAEPLRALFEEVARRPPALSAREERHGWRWRVMVMSGTALCVPDSPANRERFGFPRDRGADAPALPQARMAGLVERDTCVITHAAVGPSTAAASAVARESLRALGPGDLLLADGCHADMTSVPTACALGADVLWEIGPSVRLPTRVRLPDGSYLSDLVTSIECAERVTVRVIEPSTDTALALRPRSPGRLITNVLEHESVSARDLVALYEGCRSIMTPLDRLWAHQDGSIRVLRSRWPDGVEQELWGHLLVQHGLRAFMGPSLTEP